MTMSTVYPASDKDDKSCCSGKRCECCRRLTTVCAAAERLTNDRGAFSRTLSLFDSKWQLISVRRAANA
jgi:hypothetical protein